MNTVLIGPAPMRALEHIWGPPLRAAGLEPKLPPMARQMNGTPEALAFVASLHALKRMASPDEQARSVLYLASDAPSFTTDTALLVDGGVSINRT